MIPLSEHFSLEELTHSDTARRLGLNNSPAPEALRNLRRTAGLMEYVREILGGKSIRVNSGYRSPDLNVAIGGSPTSAHKSGHAVDFVCPAYGTPQQICELLAHHPLLSFDQLIQEGSWVHISFDPRMRRQVLTKAGSGFINGVERAH